MFKTNVSDKIINFLSEDLIQNLNILGIIENLPNAEIYVDDIQNPRGVLVNKGYFSFIYTNEDDFMQDITDNFLSKEGFYGFSGLKKDIREKLRKNLITGWETPCELYYLPKEKFNPSKNGITPRSIDIKDAEKINHYYTFKNNESLGRIKDDILNRPSSGIYIDGEIVCWVLVHDDNSMGIMYTMEEHRGKGYAYDVTSDLCKKILEMGKIPFLQINKYNNMSPGLAKKCGFVKCGDAIWVGGIKDIPQIIVKEYDTIYENFRKDFYNDDILLKYIEPERCADLIISLWDSDSSDIGIKEFELKEVKGNDELSQWCDVTSRGYCKAPEELEIFKNSLYASILKRRDNYRLFLGSIADEYVSSLGFYIPKNEFACITFLSSLEDEADYTLIKLAFELLKKEGWGISAIRCPKNKVDFYIELGAVGLK